MLQASGLQPPRHYGVAGIAAVVQQRCCGGGIALRHLATRVALRTSLRRQFSRSVRTRFAPNKQIIKIRTKKKKKSETKTRREKNNEAHEKNMKGGRSERRTQPLWISSNDCGSDLKPSSSKE